MSSLLTSDHCSLFSDVCSAHCGITPDTILVMSNGEGSSSDWQFKLADFGLNTQKKGGSSHTKNHDRAYSKF